jgi:intein-encoded DNA endonuclease-like protein
MSKKIDFSLHKENIINSYNNGIGCIKLSKFYNCSYSTIIKFLKDNNIVTKPTGNYQKYSMVDNYFNVIDNSNKSYILGLLYADGNVHTKRNMVSITVHEKDIELLDFIKSEICKDIKTYIDRVIYKKLCFSNKKLKEDLIKLGCMPNKTHFLQFPTEEQVPKEFIFDFIRGYFDGDGSMSVSSLSFTGKIEFLEKIHNELNVNSKYKCYIRHPERNNNIGSVFYSGNNVYNIYKQLYYNDSNFYLKRKCMKIKNYLIKTKKIQNENLYL